MIKIGRMSLACGLLLLLCSNQCGHPIMRIAVLTDLTYEPLLVASIQDSIAFRYQCVIPERANLHRLDSVQLEFSGEPGVEGSILGVETFVNQGSWGKKEQQTITGEVRSLLNGGVKVPVFVRFRIYRKGQSMYSYWLPLYEGE